MSKPYENKRHLPAIEKPLYQQMYKYYEGLGDMRTLKKVATQFNKSVAFLSILSHSFGWKQRIKAFDSKPVDPLVLETKSRVDDSRKKLVSVVNEIVDTLHEMMFVARDIKLGRADEARMERAKQLHDALDIWGFKWKGPNDLKRLIDTLHSITTFENEASLQKGKTPINPQQFNIERFDLHIKDD